MKYNYVDWTPIIKDYENINRTYICKPDVTKFPEYHEGDIIDENQTVRWNREEVARRMQAYSNEIHRLNAKRKTAFLRWRQDVTDMITTELLEREIFTDIATASEKAIKIYDKAWEHAHSYEIHDVFRKVDSYVDFLEELFN